MCHMIRHGVWHGRGKAGSKRLAAESIWNPKYLSGLKCLTPSDMGGEAPGQQPMCRANSVMQHRQAFRDCGVLRAAVSLTPPDASTAGLVNHGPHNVHPQLAARLLPRALKPTCTACAAQWTAAVLRMWYGYTRGVRPCLPVVMPSGAAHKPDNSASGVCDCARSDFDSSAMTAVARMDVRYLSG